VEQADPFLPQAIFYTLVKIQFSSWLFSTLLAGDNDYSRDRCYDLTHIFDKKNFGEKIAVFYNILLFFSKFGS
jgi:hypothetical protein